MTGTPLQEMVDAYCDAIRRLSARAEELGALVLFVQEQGSSASARARLRIGRRLDLR